MTLVIFLWVLSGTFYWVDYNLKQPFQLGIIGDIFVALPLCIIAGPIPIIHGFFTR